MCISPSKGFAASECASAIPAISVAAPSIPSYSTTKRITNAKHATPSSRRRRPGARIHPRILFNSHHGISGSLSTLLTCLAIATLIKSSSPGSLPSTIVSTLAAFSSIVTASSGMLIVDQAPRQTIIMVRPIKVVPPHRDAFGRTAISVYYLCARILSSNVAWMHHRVDLVAPSGVYDNRLGASVGRWCHGLAAVLYATRHFIPRSRDVDWDNGNTYVFVIPMAVGLSVDAFFQLPILQCSGGVGGGTCWNEDVISQLDLLCVLLSGLIVAFSFTLAFRGMLGIRRCYWGAALVVYGIVAYLTARAMPYISTFLR